ncbi:MAG: transcriptional regulator [Planctomycetota bacterium]
MSQPTRVIKNATDEIPQELCELVAAVGRLPESHRSEVEAAVTRVIESTRRRRRILSLVQDALGQLRLDMKYLAFDLEATRRERDEFKRQVEEAG